MALRDKVAVVTGSSAGIGAEIARAFSREGAKVTVTGRRKNELEKVASECAGGANNVLIVQGDITDETVQKRIVDETIAKFGGIDILVNNAGVVVFAPVEHGTDYKDPNDLMPIETDVRFGTAAYDQQFNINVRQVVGITSLAVPHIVKKKGNIINISSVAGKRAFPKDVLYCMSKAALDMMTAGLCIELGPLGVRVNSINPGYIKTQIMDAMNLPAGTQAAVSDNLCRMHALKRGGETSEVADAALYLASEKASFVTGSSLFVDGGCVHMTAL